MSVPAAVRLRAPGVKPFIATRPPNVTSPPASRARTPSTRTPPASNDDLAVDRLERVWKRELPHAAVLDRGAAREHRLGERPVDVRRQPGSARAADVAIEALQDPEVRIPRRLDGNRRVVEVDVAVEVELRALAEQPQPHDVEDVLVERQLDRPVFAGRRLLVAHAVVEELEVDLLDACVDDQVIDVGELPDHAAPCRPRPPW